MTDHDRPRFAELLLALAETFDETISDVRAEIYFRALLDLPLEQVEFAIVQAARGQRFFPKPAELRTQIEGDPSDAAELAWMTVLRQVRSVGYCGTPQFSDPAIGRAIADIFGGWKPLCERLPSDGPELLGWAKQFKTVYGVYQRREQGGRLLAGAERFKGLLS